MAEAEVSTTRAVFLSASVPDPARDPRYIQTADVTAIRDAVRALVAVVTPVRTLVFGGHPAISPFVLHAAHDLGTAHRVVIFVSEFFRAHVPKENLAFPHIRWTAAVPGDHARSLAQMRAEMFDAFRYTAGVFVGGMEGVEQEHALFHARWPTVRTYPVASTGGAARMLLDAGEGSKDATVRKALAEEYTYAALFARLPGVK